MRHCKYCQYPCVKINVIYVPTVLFLPLGSQWKHELVQPASIFFKCYYYYFSVISQLILMGNLFQHLKTTGP